MQKTYVILIKKRIDLDLKVRFQAVETFKSRI